MPEVLEIIENKRIRPYLEARGLYAQYQKAKQILLSGDQARVHFKEREPQNSGVWSFRVNKQFRAFGFFRAPGQLAISKLTITSSGEISHEDPKNRYKVRECLLCFYV